MDYKGGAPCQPTLQSIPLLHLQSRPVLPQICAVWPPLWHLPPRSHVQIACAVAHLVERVYFLLDSDTMRLKMFLQSHAQMLPRHSDTNSEIAKLHGARNESTAQALCTSSCQRSASWYGNHRPKGSQACRSRLLPAVVIVAVTQTSKSVGYTERHCKPICVAGRLRMAAPLDLQGSAAATPRSKFKAIWMACACALNSCNSKSTGLAPRLCSLCRGWIACLSVIFQGCQ